MEKFIYQLRKELNYSRDGQPITTASIEFRGPAMSEFDEAGEFEQLIMGSFFSMSKMSDAQTIESDKKDSNITPTAHDIRMILMSSQHIKISQVAKKFKKLAFKVATLDSKGTAFTETLFKRLSRQDFIDMICEYVANFTFPSLFDSQDT